MLYHFCLANQNFNLNFMELESFKHIWKESCEREIANSSLDPAAIKDCMGGKSQSIIADIKTNLRYEIIITIGVLLCFLVMPFVYEGALLQILLGIWALMCGLYLVFYYQKLKLVETADFTTGNVRENLKALVSRLEKYTRFYFWGNTTLIPLVHITNFILIKYTDPEAFHHFNGTSDKVVFAAYLLISSFLMVLFFRWYIERLYGRYIAQLKGYLQELEE